MTTESQDCKTNELLHRRKLRLLQVREQSKDVAKKLRLRAKVEESRQLLKLDDRKKKQFLQDRSELVRQLKEVCSSGHRELGAGHRSADDINITGKEIVKEDLSYQRARTAAAELRLKKQQHLDDQKKILDRRLHAREAANELSREKTKVKSTVGTDKPAKSSEAPQSETMKKVEIARADIGIQCPTTLDLTESDFNIPQLDLTSNDRDEAPQDVETNTEYVSENRRKNLFAVSDEMPSSLRNTQIRPTESEESTHKSRPTLTMVSEYLQQRSLHLREPIQFNSKKENLQDIKKTIDWSRKAHNEGMKNICVVHDEKIIPVPSWHKEKCPICDESHRQCSHPGTIQPNENSLTLSKSPGRITIPSKFFCDSPVPSKASTAAAKKRGAPACGVKPAVTVYDHATRDARAAPTRAEVRAEPGGGDDAYELAARESAPAPAPRDPGLDEMRHRIAMSRRNVEKEYNDTISFLNSIPRSKSMKPIKTAFMDESRQKLLKDKKQHKMQCEFKDIQKDSIRQASRTKSHSVRMSSPPAVEDSTQYSWLPVPEGEAQLAVHTLPAPPPAPPARPAAAAPPAARSVEFADGESYRYRSRHKHTPPTKDRNNRDKIQTVADDTSHSSDASQYSDTVEVLSHAEDLEPVSESKKIIIYKVVKSKRDGKKAKCKSKSSSEDAKELAGDSRSKLSSGINGADVDSSKFSLEQVEEGVYRTVSEKGPDSAGAPGPPRPRRRPAACACSRHRGGRYEWSCDERCSRGRRESDPHCRSEGARAAAEATPSFVSATDAGPAHRRDDPAALLLHARDSHTTDSYEVVIQLKKKNVPGNLQNDNQVNNSADKVVQNTPVDVHTSTADTNEVMVQESLKQPSVPTIKEPVTQTKSVATASTETEDFVEALSSSHQNTKYVCDKAVGTSFHVNTVCEMKQTTENQCRETQTSLITPSKPALHLSSSSTAYMSPPEIILPNMNQSKSAYRLNEDSRRNRHRHKHTCTGRKSYMQRFQTNLTTSKKDQILMTDELSNKVFRSVSTETGSGEAGPKKVCKHRKCSSAAKKLIVTQKIKKTLRTDIKSRNKRASINPVVKGYVNTLLNLSKDGLKVLEILDQDCSSVNTPSSSIMHTESNFDAMKPVEQKISLEQLKNIFEKQFYENILKSEYKRKVKCFFSSKKRKPTYTTKEDKKCKSSTSAKDENSDLKFDHIPNVRNASGESSSNVRSKSSPISKLTEKRYSATGLNPTTDTQNNSTSDDISTNIILKETTTELSPRKKQSKHVHKKISRASNGLKKAYHVTDSDDTLQLTISDGDGHPCDFDEELDVEDLDRMKIAQGKLQNIEKIAALTEKCAIRLSNLGKVLDKVRKNKSTYSQISATDSSSDTEPKINHRHSQNLEYIPKQTKIQENILTSPNQELKKLSHYFHNATETAYPEAEHNKISSLTKTKNDTLGLGNSSKNMKCKPPAALSRIHFKTGDDDLEPHELSTVMEVDSPMSVRTKNVSKQPNKESSNQARPSINKDCATNAEKTSSKQTHNLTNLDLLQPLANISKGKGVPNNSLDTTKLEMMDLNKFKQIMLAPFVSLEEFAKQCHVSAADEVSNNAEDALREKEKMSTDELSSAHSEGSLPDVISELLKRNMITEPFKLPTMPNINSLTVSSDSSFSTLALTRLDKGMSRKKATAETSDTVSFSSNPDLENAFKKLGMGWASSTLKKTKERLALSSSSNSSSRSGDYHPKAVETHTSEASLHRKQTKTKHTQDSTKDVEQQTSRERSMTVQEFLTTELAKKITFSNNTQRDWSDQEFVTLCETKMPEEMKDDEGGAVGERSADGDGPRARTSTPVQIYKKPAYHSSSSSNNYSNGLFSNVDDLSSVKVTSSSLRNHSTSDKDELTIPSCSLKLIISKPSGSD